MTASITIDLPRESAVRILKERGYTPVRPRPVRGHARQHRDAMRDYETLGYSPAWGWAAPNGEHYWQTDEALRVALTS